MKYLIATFFVISVLLIGQQVKACEIEFTILGDKQENFAVGDEIIVKIAVTFTHRVCPEGIETTKFKYAGLKVLGATKWEEIANGKYERKLKVEVLEGDEKEVILEAIRKCDKEGGYGKISLKRAKTV